MKLIKYDQACKAIALAKSVDEVKHIRNISEAQRAYARQAKNKQLEIDAVEIRIRAGRRLGELMEEQKKTVGLNPGTRTKGGGGFSGGSIKNPPENIPTLGGAGIDKHVANQARQLARLPKEKFEDCIQKWRQDIENNGNRVTTAFIRQMRDDEKKADLHREIHIQSPGIIVGDFREMSKEIPDNSVELIFTDPPYDRDSVPLYEAAAEIGARILKSGGSLITYVGHLILFDVQPLMCRHLRYWWTNACVHGGSNARMTEYGIVAGWKPMLWFVKEYRGDRQTFIEDTVIGGREKDLHDWQQSELEADHYIYKLTSSTGLVVDFFCGAGTTCVAAAKLGRLWTAFEIDPVTAQTADQRILSMLDL